MGIKRNFIPVDEKERDLLLKIQKEVCASSFMDKFRYNLIPETFDIYTTVIAFMTGVHKIFAADDITEINIGDVLVIEKSLRRRATAEKSGSINCTMRLGDVGQAIVDQGIHAFTDSLENNTEMRKVMMAASAHAVKFLTDYAIGSIKPEDVYHISIAFFAYMLATVDECSKNENIKPEDFKINIGSDLGFFRIGFAFKNGKRLITLNVGPAPKLTVKSDAFTE